MMRFPLPKSFVVAIVLWLLLWICAPAVSQIYVVQDAKPDELQRLSGDSDLEPDELEFENGLSSNCISDACQKNPSLTNGQSANNDLDWIKNVRAGYDEDAGFVIASQAPIELGIGDAPFLLNFNGWGQLRYTYFNSQGPNSQGLDQNANQFQLKRARIVFSGSAFSSDFSYFVQLDGRSSSGDNLRLLDYFLSFDIGHHSLGLEPGRLGFRTGKYKMPFHLARWMSGREFQFTDRAMAPTFFDVNRSLAWGLYGQTPRLGGPLDWEVAIFNGLVTGGAETGSSGSLDDNFAYSGRVFWHPIGEWGTGELADFDCHCRPAVRVGGGVASSMINRLGQTEFDTLRVVDSGNLLSSLLPATVDQYTVNLYAVDVSTKYRGWSMTFEYYFRTVDRFEGAAVPDLFDHGHWLQIGKFVVPEKIELLARWSRVSGNSGTLGMGEFSSDSIAGGLAWYFRGQNAKLVSDVTYLNGTPVNSSSLDQSPGDIGWLYRTQIQFAF